MWSPTRPTSIALPGRGPRPPHRRGYRNVCGLAWQRHGLTQWESALLAEAYVRTGRNVERGIYGSSPTTLEKLERVLGGSP